MNLSVTSEHAPRSSTPVWSQGQSVNSSWLERSLSPVRRSIPVEYPQEQLSSTRSSARERLGRRFLSPSPEVEVLSQVQHSPPATRSPPPRRFRSRSRSPSPATLQRRARNRQLGELLPTRHRTSATETSPLRSPRSRGQHQTSSSTRTIQCRSPPRS